MGADEPLRELMTAIATGDDAAIERLLSSAPQLARVAAQEGARRAEPGPHFLAALGCYVYAGDTALHIAAAAFRPDLVRRLIELGAEVGAQDRRGATPLHFAATANPDGAPWDPEAQAQTIAALAALGAATDALDRNGTTPLHRAIRTRCSAAVAALLDAGADAAWATRSGTSPMALAQLTTGRGGSGSRAARAEQAEIIRLLEERGAA